MDEYATMMMGPLNLIVNMCSATADEAFNARVSDFSDNLTRLAYKKNVGYSDVQGFLLEHSTDYGPTFEKLFSMGPEIASYVMSCVRVERQEFRWTLD